RLFFLSPSSLILLVNRAVLIRYKQTYCIDKVTIGLCLLAELLGIVCLFRTIPKCYPHYFHVWLCLKSEYACCSRFMEQRYVRVLNVGKRSRQVCKKNVHLWVVFFSQNLVPTKH